MKVDKKKVAPKDGFLEMDIMLDKDRQYRARLKEELEIDKNSLSDEFTTQAAKFAWWGVLAELAGGKRDRLKAQLDALHVALDLEIRTEIRKTGVKKTEGAILSEVKSDVTYRALTVSFLAAKEQAGVLQVATRSFEQRKDMLISLGATLRKERDGEISILAERAKSIQEGVRNGT